MQFNPPLIIINTEKQLISNIFCFHSFNEMINVGKKIEKLDKNEANTLIIFKDLIKNLLKCSSTSDAEI